MKPRVSVVVTAYNEGEAIVAFLDRLLESIQLPCEVLVVYDTPDDTTASWVKKFQRKDEPRGTSLEYLRSWPRSCDSLRL